MVLFLRRLFRRNENSAQDSAAAAAAPLPSEETPLVGDPDQRLSTAASQAADAAASTMEFGPIPSKGNRLSVIIPDSLRERFASRHKRDVIYDEQNHLEVMFQVYGSVWPKVLPWCVVVMALTYLFVYLRKHNIVDVTIQDATGHNFMSILVSFLLVTRVTITYNRFMEARQNLQDLFLASRELIQYTCVLTNCNTSKAAQMWRQEVAYRIIVALRLAMAAVEFQSTGISGWDCVPSQDHLLMPLMLDPNDPCAADHKAREGEPALMQTLQHGTRTTFDENFRTPIVYMYHLREMILEPRKDERILAQRNWHVNESLKLLAITSNFISAFHGLKKLVLTPFPFPLIQLNRIFLFAWCFSLPMVLMKEGDEVVELLVLVFFTTFGFLGLEMANIELDDPFGTDPNDFPSTRWAESVYEDVYLVIYKTDGYNAALKLRTRITEEIAQGNQLITEDD